MKANLYNLTIINQGMDSGDPTTNLTSLNQEFASGTAPGSTIYPATFTVKCKTGFMFPDGTTSKTMTTNVDGSWGYQVACISMDK